MSQIKISVILPVYNSQDYVREAIQSVLNQTYSDFELIIINDGSTDNSSGIIESFKDKRIMYINNSKNSGLISTLNEGLRRANGKYIARMDADDICLPDRFQKQVEVLEKSDDVVLVSSDFYELKGSNLKLSTGFNGSDEIKTVLLFAPGIAHPTVMMRNIFKEKSIQYNSHFLHVEDYQLWTELSFIGDMINIDRPLLKYRSHNAQVSAQFGSVQRTNSEKVRELYLRRRGFVFSEEDLLTHHLIGNNIFITSASQLQRIEIWLCALIEQNRRKKILQEKEFERVIHKFWLDSCGYTSLGLFAYRSYFVSQISTKASLTFVVRSGLFLKCLIRRFRQK